MVLDNNLPVLDFKKAFDYNMKRITNNMYILKKDTEKTMLLIQPPPFLIIKSEILKRITEYKVGGRAGGPFEEVVK